MSKNILTRFKKTMKKVLATVLTGAMVMAMGGVVVQADEVDKSESIVVYTNNGGEGRD